MARQKEIKNYLNSAYRVASVPKGTRYFTRELLQLAISQMTNTISIQGLPASLPRDDIEKSLIITGNAVFVEKFGQIWCPFGFQPYGGLAYNVYQTSIKFVGSSPRLGTMQGFDMIDGVIAYNTDIDKAGEGSSLLFETITRYAGMLAHLESTLVNSLITKRAGRVGIASTNETATAVDAFLDSLEIGDTKTIQSASTFVADLKKPEFGDDNNISDFTQARDYLKNCFLNEIGLQTLEEKKERMITDELSLDADVLNIQLLTYIRNRFEMITKLNNLYGLNLTMILRG